MTHAYRLLMGALPALAILVLVSGCGSSGPELGEVRGKVTLSGKPLAGAKVIFQPTAKEGGSPSTATTDAEGNYELMYPGGREGAILGIHKVTVSTYRQESLPDGTHRDIPERVPPKYTSTKDTPLSEEVKPGGNEINLEVTP